MAIIVPVVTIIGRDGNEFKAVIETLTTTNDSSTPIEITDYDDVTVAFIGTFGVGGTIILQGSNDKTNWFPMTDLLGNAISKTAAAMERAVERCQWLRVFVSAGDGTTDLDATITMRRVRENRV